MKKTIIAYWVVVLLAFIACLYFVVYVTKAIADEPIDYSWVQRLAEEKVSLMQEIPQLEKDIYEKKKRLEVIECKIDKVDRDATCSFQ